MDILPWVISTDTLEYDLTSRIRSLVRDTERWIAVIVGESARQWNDHFGYVHSILAEAGIRIRLMAPGEEIPDNTPGLLVLGGAEEIDDWALYRIDRYIQLGGKVFFAAEGVYVDTIQNTIQARPQQDLGLLSMIASYGVTVRPELALDRNALTLQYQTRMPNGAVQIKIVRYPLWIGIPSDYGNPEHPVSANFNGIDLYWPSPLDIHPAPEVEARVLFTSSPNAWCMTRDFQTNPDTPFMFEMEAGETKGVKIFGAALSGVFPSHFKDREKPLREGSEEELPDLPENAKAARIIVVGDMDFATNLINATQARKNLEFILRAADWLISDDDIIGIRSRQPQIGRFDKISDLDMRAAVKKMSQIINVGLIPILVIAAGIFRAVRRSRAMNSGQRTNNNEQLADNDVQSTGNKEKNNGV